MDLLTILTGPSALAPDQPKVCLVAKSKHCQTDAHHFVEKQQICITVNHSADFR